MKLIDADELMNKLKHDCETNNNSTLWFILGFISKYINEAPDVSTKFNKHPLERE